MKLQIVNFQVGVAAQADEFCYLFDWLVNEAKTVFSAVSVSSYEHTGNLPEDVDYILLIGQDPVYLSARSLVEMQQQLVAGVDVVVPVSLTDCAGIGEMALYSLSDFQRIESVQLGFQDNETIAPVLDNIAAVSLWRRSALSDCWSSLASSIIENTNIASQFTEKSVAAAGLFYAFIDYYGQTRTDILPFIPAGAKDILEIGCGKGHTGAFLQAELSCRVSGVELQPEIAAEAKKRLHKVLVADVESLVLDKRYDVVMGLDVIEHLRQPGDFFSWTRQHLYDDGALVAVIPNVGHYSVVRDLLAGRWDYVPMGILCVTHVRFFTRTTLELWLQMAGFKHWQISARKSPLPADIETWGQSINADLESLATEAFYLVAKNNA